MLTMFGLIYKIKYLCYIYHMPTQTFQLIGHPEIREEITWIDRGLANTLGLTYEGFRSDIGPSFRSYEGGAPDFRIWTLTDEDAEVALEEGRRNAQQEIEASLAAQRNRELAMWGELTHQAGLTMHDISPELFPE